MKIVTIVGARPQFIKAAALSRQLRASPIREILVHTGQHYAENMSGVFFRELGIPEPAHNLEVGSASHAQQVGLMLPRLEEVLLAERPDWVVVYGDTNSTLAGALAACKIHQPVAHVEAGLRSFKRSMPEEVNRVVTDHLSEVLFCPSETAVGNLRREGITEQVFQVGDIMADALQFAAGLPESGPAVLESLGLQGSGFVLATCHRAENTDDPERLEAICGALNELEDPVVFTAHPRTRKALTALGLKLRPQVHLIEPVGYVAMVKLLKAARILLTDSGGLQKEAYWLRCPCVTLRDETEWVETVETGWNQLAGADPVRIRQAVLRASADCAHPPLYGDGKTAERILDVLEKTGR